MAAHAANTILSDHTLTAIPRPGHDFDVYDGPLLSPLLIPRIPGTAGNEHTLRHLVSFFAKELPHWHVELHSSSSYTPLSVSDPTQFTNVIATRDPPYFKTEEVRRLVLAAHRDSKSLPEGFIGAIDSALPCAILLHVARAIDGALTKKWAMSEGHGTNILDPSRGVQIVFFDGEEAFEQWSETDSLYGSRALAEKWSRPHPGDPAPNSDLSRIELFVLLDLLGSNDPRIPSLIPSTHGAYLAMAALEKRLRSLGLFRSSLGCGHPSKDVVSCDRHLGYGKPNIAPVWFEDYDRDAEGLAEILVPDDHTPFQKKGVRVLHIIPFPFPDVWHTLHDDGEHIDKDTAEDWGVLITAFATEWLHLDGLI